MAIDVCPVAVAQRDRGSTLTAADKGNGSMIVVVRDDCSRGSGDANCGPKQSRYGIHALGRICFPLERNAFLIPFNR